MIERRSVLKGLASLPLAAVLADPRQAHAVAETTSLVKIRTKGGQDVAGALAKPAKLPAPVVVLVHEWWGLNDQIKATANELANQGYLVLALDLFQGRVAATPDEARALVQSVQPDAALDTVTSWIEWARNHQDGTRKVGVVGWCFGGGWALNGSVAAPVNATVVYYGKCDLPPEKLARLMGPVLGHFGSRDTYIDKPMVDRFETAMHRAGRPYKVYWYDAGHAFANPTGDNFNKPDAQLAWTRTTEFLRANLAK
ncbi:MAG TPA: dienelactone hydrolase family protein [Patescibacteria group bacterium]|nr:dienelactone hydrolase family protein [Patescibacteria group bacterium]